MAETEDVWKAGAQNFMRIEHTSQKRVLHPRLAKLINDHAPASMLDFGCGDGRILELLHPGIDIAVYDTSPAMIDMVTDRMGDRLKGIYSASEEIPRAAFDLVLMTMVVICLRDRKELDDAFALISEVLAPGGTALVATSHPCFRQYEFSNFHTSFGRGQHLDYLAQGLPFQVTLEDSPEQTITFTDHHWSFSETLNSIIRSGMIITEVIETPDDLDHPRAHKGLPAFLIIQATKP